MPRLILFIIALNFSTLLWADTGASPMAEKTKLKADIAGLRIPIHLEPDHTGVLVQLHQWLMNEAKIEAPLQVMPSGRALALLENSQVDGIYPTWVPDKYNTNVIFSKPFMKVNHYIYGKHGDTPFRSLTELSDRRLGLIQNYQLGLDFSIYENLYISYARNSQTLITLLLSGRVDAIVLGDVEARALELAMKIEPLSVDLDSMLLVRELGYTFLNNEEGERLLQRVNDAIAKANEIGIVDNLLQEAARRLQ